MPVKLNVQINFMFKYYKINTIIKIIKIIIKKLHLPPTPYIFFQVHIYLIGPEALQQLLKIMKCISILNNTKI